MVSAGGLVHGIYGWEADVLYPFMKTFEYRVARAWGAQPGSPVWFCYKHVETLRLAWRVSACYTYAPPLGTYEITNHLVKYSTMTVGRVKVSFFENCQLNTPSVGFWQWLS